MDCRNHVGIPAVARCAGCAEPMCGNCLVEIRGQQYCGACKVMAIRGQPTVPGQVLQTCKEAKEALIMSIVGLFCFGIIIEPMALFKASKARQEIAANPTLGGSGMATAATVIAAIGLVLWLIGMYMKFSSMNRPM